MSDSTKFGLLRRILKAIGLSKTAVDDLIDWITNRLVEEQQATVADESAPIFPYRIRDDFLSPAERNFYYVLRNVVGTRFLICPKVSLADLFFVKSSDPREYRVYANKIDRKHVDFVLCDPQTLVPLAGIELDDKSHERSDRKQRDGFVEGVFAAAGLKLLRVRVQRGYSSQELTAMLRSVLPALAEKTALEMTQSPTAVRELPNELSPTNGEEVRKESTEATRVVLSSPQCPKCGSKMLLRTAKKGTNEGQRFWGCSNFPRCRAMVPYVPVAT